MRQVNVVYARHKWGQQVRDGSHGTKLLATVYCMCMYQTSTLLGAVVSGRWILEVDDLEINGGLGTGPRAVLSRCLARYGRCPCVFVI
jgi:hypothetical protein